MAESAAERAVRTYLAALKDPSALRDEGKVAKLQEDIAGAGDPVKRLRLRQQLLDAERPSLSKFEDEFVTHAKTWADENGLSSEVFAAEGVSAGVLRRAGFAVRGGGGRRPAGARRRASGRRVTTEQVLAAVPRGAFTTRQLQESSGASPAVVRKAIQAEVAAGRLVEQGTDPGHKGPGRSPTLYKRSK